jgi:two-component system response regulator AtoC
MKSILIAEDDKNFGIVLKSELGDDEHIVNLVQDGVEAVLSFLSDAYDFVLLDIRMPKLNGVDALRIIKKINPRIPAITFSGDAGNREREESVRAGSIKCLAKPFEVGQLKKEIEDCIAGPKGKGDVDLKEK